MKTSNKTKLPLLSLIVLFIVVTFTALSVIFSVGRTIPSSSYKTDNSDNKTYYNVLVYKVTVPEKHQLHSIWINLGSTDKTQVESNGELKTVEDIEIMVGRAKDESANFTYRSDGAQDKANKSFKVKNTEEGVKVGQWQKLYDYNTPVSADYSYYAIATANNILINEIAFVGVEEDGTDGAFKDELVLLQAEGVASGINGKQDDTTEAWYKSLKDRTNILDRTIASISNAEKLLDEQVAFNTRKIVDGEYVDKDAFTQKELSVARTLNSLYSSTADYFDETENPIGMILLSLSTSVFGVTQFTVRLMPILFAIGSIVLSCFIAKKFTKNDYVCAGVSFLVALGNFFIVITSAFTWAIGIFFALLSVYFVVRYIKCKNTSSNDSIVYLLLGGLSYAFSLGVKTMLMFSAVVIFALVVYGICSRYAKAIKNDKDGKTRVIRYNMYREIACAVVGFVAVPVVVLASAFGVCLPALFNVYGTGNLFGLASKHFFGAF